MKFSEKVKKVRTELLLSQEALAKELGVSFATVNRWESQSKNPHVVSMGKFLMFCRNNNINFDEKVKQTLSVDFYDNIEKQFNVLHPNSGSATYTSELNFSLEKETSTQRWYRYKEGFSANLVKKLIRKYNCWDKGYIFDPFLGSGTTILAANELGLNGIGCEVNPFSAFLATCKLQSYTVEEIEQYNESFRFILSKIDIAVDYTLPVLSFSNNVFNKDIERVFFNIKQTLQNLNCSCKIKNLFKLALLSMIDEFAKYKKAGNGLKFKVENKIKNQTKNKGRFAP